MKRRSVLRPLVLTLSRGGFDALYLALSMTAAEAASGRTVTLFCTRAGVRWLTPAGFVRLTDADGNRMDQIVQRQAAAEVPDLSLLLSALAAQQVDIVACRDSLAEFGITPEQLRCRLPILIKSLPMLVGEITGEAGGDFGCAEWRII